jgi:hypothetical protein
LDADHPENGVLIPCRFTGEELKWSEKHAIYLTRSKAGEYGSDCYS